MPIYVPKNSPGTTLACMIAHNSLILGMLSILAQSASRSSPTCRKYAKETIYLFCTPLSAERQRRRRPEEGTPPPPTTEGPRPGASENQLQGKLDQPGVVCL